MASLSLRVEPLLLRSVVQEVAMLLFFTILFTTAPTARAEKDSNPYPWGENPNNQAFRMYWNDARNVLQDLDKFQSLYIKYHGCVWSECSRGDSYDDDGENRDGDEYWYQYRTQPFCANAAFSLYGVLKNHWLQFNHCSRATYINSFFTYGGADTVFEALNLQAETVFDQMDYDDDGYGESHSNAVCYEIEDENNNNNNNNNNRLLWEEGGEEAGHQEERDLESNDNNNNYYNNYGTSSTMGCSAKGSFVAALFEGQTCDGNYYLGSNDDLKQYNRKMKGVRCRQVWNRFTHSSGAGTYNRRGRRLGRELEDNNNNNNNNNGNNNDYYAISYNSPAEYLLSHSWACDVSLYPSGCPDPYGLKSKYDAVLAAVASGKRTGVAIWQVRLHTPLMILSTLFLLAAVALLGLSYYMYRQADAKAAGTWRPILWKDTKYFCTTTLPKAVKELLRTLRRGCRACLRMMPFEVRKRRRRRNGAGGGGDTESRRSRRSKDGKERRSSRKRGSRRRDEGGPTGGDDDDGNLSPSSSQRSKRKGRKSKRGSSAVAADAGTGDDEDYLSSQGGYSTNYSSYSEQDQF